MARPIKQASYFRWMGCKLAVYEFSGQMKAEVRGESSSRGGGRRRGSRGKRRGNSARARRKLARKCRGVATVDPSPPLKCEVRAHRLSMRSGYLTDRTARYANRVKEKMVASYTRFHRVSTTLSARGDPRPEEVVRKAQRQWKGSRLAWIRFYCAYTKSSRTYGYAVMNTMLQVLTLGWDSLNRVDSPAAPQAVVGPSGSSHSEFAPVPLGQEPTRYRRGARFVQQCSNCRVSWESRSRTSRCPRCYPVTRAERVGRAVRRLGR